MHARQVFCYWSIALAALFVAVLQDRFLLCRSRRAGTLLCSCLGFFSTGIRGVYLLQFGHLNRVSNRGHITHFPTAATKPDKRQSRKEALVLVHSCIMVREAGGRGETGDSHWVHSQEAERE